MGGVTQMLGLNGKSKSRVSKLAKKLDTMVETFRNCLLGHGPYASHIGVAVFAALHQDGLVFCHQYGGSNKSRRGRWLFGMFQTLNAQWPRRIFVIPYLCNSGVIRGHHTYLWLTSRFGPGFWHRRIRSNAFSSSTTKFSSPSGLPVRSWRRISSPCCSMTAS
ncbi:hypothetical protein KAX17_03385, partial [Candidatus Bipolaricaulota bacterium]|nr:hypothetical protein [Candidatus Bipolaricaulota bacterium]